MGPPLRQAGRLGLTCRAVADADLPFVAALYASTRTEELAVTGWPEETKRDFLAHQHEAQHRHYQAHYPGAEWLILERDGAAIGRLYLDEQEAEIRLIDISLVPDSRGAGLGSAILADLLAWAGGRGKMISLHVESFNPARRLYARLGFLSAGPPGAYERMEWRPQTMIVSG